ncbi:ABC transporter permease subunit, partial [Cupriavidus sp. SIMBA_020]|uniref:ABC transporter permease subunit n=1 Tax=Cupriavidus sp. SIMBA_020 TaxID=3085766 RepID=UPI00397C2B1C
IGLALPFLVRSDYSLTVMSTAFIFALATIGLNLLTGYTGQFNLAHGGFMAVGAYAAWNFGVRFPGMPLIVQILLGGCFATIVGVIFGIP